MKESLYVPPNYKPLLDPNETEKAILLIKNYFQTNLAFELNLTRVTAPLVVESGTGINDDLSGTERPIRFKVKAMGDTQAEIVQSLAKWKRMALADLGFRHGEGIYTDMNAIRPDDRLDNIHSIYVDQWDSHLRRGLWRS
jgi:aspartate--ammonia ligase